MNDKYPVLVTGGTGTLGSAIVHTLRASGRDVVANYCHDELRALRLRDRSGCAILRADLRVEEQVVELFQRRRFAAVVHCIGLTRDALLVRQSIGDWREVLSANAETAFLVTREGLKTLPRGGQIVLLASRVGESGYLGQSAYAAAKGAVLGLARCAAREGEPLGIAVNALLPGFVPSALSRDLTGEVLERRAEQNLLPDAEPAEALAAFVLWLLSGPRGTGQIFQPDCRI